jgi:hypothetical protein
MPGGRNTCKVPTPLVDEILDMSDPTIEKKGNHALDLCCLLILEQTHQRRDHIRIGPQPSRKEARQRPHGERPDEPHAWQGERPFASRLAGLCGRRRVGDG